MSATLLSSILLLLFQGQSDSLTELRDEAVSAGPARILQLADAADWVYDEGWQESARALMDQGSVPQRLLVGRLLARGGDATAAPELGKILAGADRDTALAVFATLSLATFQGEEAAQGALVDWLGEQIIEDDPSLYTEACLALYRIGDGGRRRAALRYMRHTRESEDRETVRLGAVALAQTSATLESGTLQLLEEVAQGIGGQAALARALLDKQEQRQRFRSKLQALENLYAAESEPTDAFSADDVELIDRILLMASRLHMEGDKYSREELIAAAADGMLSKLDPYSTYFTGQEYSDFWFDLNPEYGGIGAYVNTVNGFFTIVRPIYSGPAFEVGLLTGDRILSVDGWPTIDEPNDDIIKRLKGPPETMVKLEVFREGWDEPRHFDVKRRKIELPVLQTEMLPDGVLYLELIGFTIDCGRLVAEAILDARSEGNLNGVVLDLRNNPGGSLEQAVAVCDAFLPAGKLIVTTRARIGEIERHVTRTRPLVDSDIPLTVLINEYSASASEIVSGALSIHGRATTIGKRTHGKGSVQVMRPLPGLDDEPYTDGNRNRMKDEWEEFEDLNGNGKYDFGPKVKMTIAYYFLPDGSTIHTQRDHEGRVTEQGGVDPDKKVDFWRYEPIVIRELNRLLDTKAFRDYADTIVKTDPDLAVRLAEFDGRETALYPGWAEFYTSLETFLEEDSARQWVRRRLREGVSDLRGSMFPGGGFRGDFQEDPQLAAAIRELLGAVGRDPEEVREYKLGLAQIKPTN